MKKKKKTEENKLFSKNRVRDKKFRAKIKKLIKSELKEGYYA